MARDYLNIRLSYEAKYWIEELLVKKQEELDSLDSNYIIDEIENKIVKDYKQLNGISITVLLKVSISSIIELAVNETKKYSLEQWNDIRLKMAKAKVEDEDRDVGTLTPRLYLDKEVIKMLKEYQDNFKTDKKIRVPRMSYIIKCVVYAYYLNSNI